MTCHYNRRPTETRVMKRHADLFNYALLTTEKDVTNYTRKQANEHYKETARLEK